MQCPDSINKRFKRKMSAQIQNNDAEATEMRIALTNIVREIKSFNDNEPCFKIYTREDNTQYMNKLNVYRLRMNLKSRKIKRLRQQLRLSCDVSKLLLSSKENGDVTIERKSNQYKNQYCNKLLSIINEGYGKLPKDQLISTNKLEISTINKLQKIIFSGQYYWQNFCIERFKNQLLNQNIEFLKNKIRILENYL